MANNLPALREKELPSLSYRESERVLGWILEMGNNIQSSQAGDWDIVTYVQYDDGTKGWMQEGHWDSFDITVTHWMPLPLEPK